MQQFLDSGPVAIWGALLATALGAIKIWETFFRDRLRLATTFYRDTLPEHDDTITIVNHGSTPAMVSHWSLAWEPQWVLSRRERIDVTPEYEPGDVTGFKIAAHSDYTLNFDYNDSFDWGSQTSDGRKLVLSLSIFGRKRPKRLEVTRGAGPFNW